MKRISISRIFQLALVIMLFLNSCVGIKYITVETREPARIALPKTIRSILVVDNTVKQPNDYGHYKEFYGSNEVVESSASSDSLAFFYTEALAQFLGEDEFFDEVKHLQVPLRTDDNFWLESAISPEDMIELRKVSNCDAILSLENLSIETYKQERYREGGYTSAHLFGRLNSTLRVYAPTMEGLLPTVHYRDSLLWDGFDVEDRNAYSPYYFIPTVEEAMKELVVRAADKMSYVLTPYWMKQDRWYYISSEAKMKEGVAFAEKNQWQNALESWLAFYDSERDKRMKAKAANNIALAYEMIDDLQRALEWAVIAEKAFQETSGPKSLDLRRAVLLKNEYTRRLDTSNRLNLEAL